MDKDTDYCKVIAIIRNDALAGVERRLQELGVQGISVTGVRGYGEYADYYSPELLTRHLRIEIFATARQGDAIAKAVMDAVHSGLAGTGSWPCCRCARSTGYAGARRSGRKSCRRMTNSRRSSWKDCFHYGCFAGAVSSDDAIRLRLSCSPLFG